MYRTVHNIFALRSALNKFPLLPRNRKQVDGFAYERSAIEQWLKTHNTSPATGAELESKQLIPCHPLRSLIREFQEACA